MAEPNVAETPGVGTTPISTHDFAWPGAAPHQSTGSSLEAPTEEQAGRARRFFRRSLRRTEGRGGEPSTPLTGQPPSQPASDNGDGRASEEAPSSFRGSARGEESDVGGYKLEVILLPGDKREHCLDIVAIHDYDETAESWVYKDRDELLRRKIENLKAKKNRLQGELSARRSSISSHEDGDRDPNPGKSGSAHDFANLAPDTVTVTPFPLGQQARQDIRRDAEGISSSRHSEAGSSRTSSPGGRASGVNWLKDAAMLPHVLPGARVLLFSYPRLKLDPKDGTQAGYLDGAAAELLRLLVDARLSDGVDYSRVPVVIIAAGFGGVIAQKAIVSALTPSSTPDTITQAPGTIVLDHLADVVFLDTPFLDDESQEPKGFFPANVNVRASAVVEVMGIMKGLWNGTSVAGIWGEFWACMCKQRGREARVLWFFSSTGRTQPVAKKLCLISETGEAKSVALHPLHTHRLRRLTNFHGPDDPNYQTIMTRLCENLMLRAVSDENLKGLQRDMMRAHPIAGIKDELGRSLLHRAVTAPNPAAVNMLLGNHADSQERDVDGQTPLHCAIRMFCDGTVTPVQDKIAERIARGRLRKIIEQLLDFTSKSELYNSRDRWNVTPHDLLYGDKKRGDTYRPAAEMSRSDYNTLRELLRNHQPVVSRRLEETKQQPWKDWGPPSETSPALSACERAKAIVAEFYMGTEDDNGGILADYDVPSVFELVYQKDRGPEKVLSRLAERHLSRRGEVRCRWIHVPANNEQWLEDLFLRLRIVDRSMVGQRHSGHTVFNKYMVAQAKRYKQKPIEFVPSIEVQTPIATAPLDPIPEDGETGGNQKGFEDSEFLEVLRAEGGGWPSIHRPIDLRGSSEAIVLFMPILSYEKHRERKVMWRAIRRASKAPDTRQSAQWEAKTHNAEVDTSLIEAYLNSKKPLHCRRTLDQYSYYMLETTESRDLDQVVYKWAQAENIFKAVVSDLTKDDNSQKDEARHRPIIMVDQLWLWILPDGTVLTSLPNTASAGETYNLKTQLEVALFDNRPSNSPVQSVEDLLWTILRICVDFASREGPCGVKFQDCFQYSISDIAEDEANMYTSYKQTVKFLEALGPAALSNEKKIDTFSQVTNETNRLVEIMDIQDELKIIDSVLAMQKNVLQTLAQQITGQKRVGVPEGAEKPSATNKPESNREKEHKPVPATAVRDPTCVYEAIGIVEDQIRSVAEMVNSAKRVQEDLKQLLDFKQQQSNAWETRFSRKLAEQGQKQNNIMLVFTLVTIVFLPMSFISSFFALGVEEFPKDSTSGNTSWPISEVSAYLFGISIAVSLPMIIAAFYVNPISRMVKGKRKRDLRYLKEALAADRPEGHDSDPEDSDTSDDSLSGDEKPGTMRNRMRIRRHKHRKKLERQPTFSEDDDEDYAPLFGRHRGRLNMVHTKIPLVRRLWEYKTYRLPELQDLDAAGLEDLEWDYPLSRWRKMIAKPVDEVFVYLGLGGLSRRYVDYVKNYRLERESDELIRELFIERMEIEDIEREKRRAEIESRKQGLNRDGMSSEKKGRTPTGGLSIRSKKGGENSPNVQVDSGQGLTRRLFRRALARGGSRPARDEESLAQQ
ncbi:hypothetical protein QBC47DRAFT_397946 [Echria macrotheca]|uniref:Ankyrin repeat protein n=1 Tax=Echria macrotheca TaxID=438768 RepID=A0AAJ0F9I6_9PEZI|nr:hypothetical protein QBC47DRAFT_397946 [Echria macrotheca]